MPRILAHPYTKTSRLSEVLSMLQVLGLDESTHRSESGLCRELKRKPESASTWTEIASEHPEFFRVSGTGEHQVSLIARHVVPRDEQDRKPSLEPDVLGTLLTLALDLHDRQCQRADRWRTYVPIVVPIIASVITGGVTLLGILLTRS